MASYHCTVKVGSRGTAGKHSDYVQRTGAYENYKSGEDLVFTESINMPSWAEHNPSEFFRQADLNERANGAAYREIEIALPRELTQEQRIEFVREFVQQEIGTNHPCTWAIHQPKAAIERGEQPHAHIMFSDRKLDGIERSPEQFFKRAAAAYRDRKTKELVQPDEAAKAKGGCAKADTFSGSPTERREKLVGLRERFATHQNRHLEKHGHQSRVDHRSLAEQGINRQPEKHLGPVASRQQESVILLVRHRAYSRDAEAAEKYVAATIDLSGNITAALTERKNHEQRAERNARTTEPASIANLQSVHGVHNVHDLNQRAENVLQPHAPDHVRQQQAPANHADLHKPNLARARVEPAAPPSALELAVAELQRLTNPTPRPLPDALRQRIEAEQRADQPAQVQEVKAQPQLSPMEELKLIAAEYEKREAARAAEQAKPAPSARQRIEAEFEARQKAREEAAKAVAPLVPAPTIQPAPQERKEPVPAAPGVLVEAEAKADPLAEITALARAEASGQPLVVADTENIREKYVGEVVAKTATHYALKENSRVSIHSLQGITGKLSGESKAPGIEALHKGNYAEVSYMHKNAKYPELGTYARVSIFKEVRLEHQRQRSNEISR